MTEDIYSKLAKAYLEGIESKYLPEILEMCLTEEEVSLLLLLPGAVEEIAEKYEIEQSRTSSLLEELYRDGFVIRKETSTGLLYALVNELFEFILEDKKIFKRLKDPQLQQRYLGLWNSFFEDEIVPTKSLSDAMIPQARVIPIEKTVPMKWGEILPLESISAILNNARTIARTQCTCRVMARKCDNPTDVCILLDDFADLIIDRGAAVKITPDEALDIANRAEELGLIHHLNNTGPEGYNFICNCCSCCCIILRGMMQLGKEQISYKSRYLSKIDQDKCDGCGVCAERCQFRAIEMVDDKALVNEKACFGCGLCAFSCPNEAIEMTCVRDTKYITEHLQEAPDDLIDDMMVRNN